MPKDGDPAPEFPLTNALTQLVSQDNRDAMNACELGAHVLLLERAWGQSGTLPDDDALLARWSRLPAATWPQARPLALAGFTVGADGRLHHGRTKQVRADLDALAAKRSRAARARWSGRQEAGPAPPDPDAHAMQVHSTCIPHAPAAAPPHPPSASIPDPKAPALQRPRDARNSVPGAAEEPEVSLRLVGAGARALVGDMRRKAWMRRLLSRATFPLAEPKRRTIPPSKIAEIAGSRHATPMLVAYAIDRVNSMLEKAVAQGLKPGEKKYPNPIGLLIAAVGAQIEEPRPPWEVELWFSATWAQREAEMEQLLEMQDRIERVRSEAGWKNEMFYDENEEAT
jgi:uncharacterized protein YdaU (DUF1376 family)